MLQPASTNLNRTPGWDGQRKAVSALTIPISRSISTSAEHRPQRRSEPTLSDSSSPAEAAAVAPQSRDLHWMMIPSEVAQQNPLLTAL